MNALTHCLICGEEKKVQESHSSRWYYHRCRGIMGKSFDNDVMDGPPPDYTPANYKLIEQGRTLNECARECHGRSLRAGWYHDPQTGQPIQRNVAEMLCLIHSEVSEALEGYRKDLMDTHLPDRKMVEVELADVLIRVFDLAAYLNVDLGESYVRKLCYNAVRIDHKPEVRAQGGKKF